MAFSSYGTVIWDDIPLLWEARSGFTSVDGSVTSRKNSWKSRNPAENVEIG